MGRIFRPVTGKLLYMIVAEIAFRSESDMNLSREILHTKDSVRLITGSLLIRFLRGLGRSNLLPCLISALLFSMSSVISGLIGQTPSILIFYVIDDLDLFAGIEGLDQAKDIIFKICFIYDYFYFSFGASIA